MLFFLGAGLATGSGGCFGDPSASTEPAGRAGGTGGGGSAPEAAGGEEKTSSGFGAVTLSEGSPEPTQTASSTLSLQGARNEWLDTYLRLPPAGAPGEAAGRGSRLTVSDLVPGDSTANSGAGGERIPAAVVRLYRVVLLPFDTRAVRSVRERGPGSEETRLPAALIPLEAQPSGASSKEGGGEDKGGAVYVIPPGTQYLYAEVKVPLTAAAGGYTGTLRLSTPRASGGLFGGEREEAASVALRLGVDDLAISDEPTASVYGEVPFDDLRRLFPRQFGAVTVSSMLSRTDARFLLATERMDEIVRLCKAHRLDVGFTQLQPVVKYTPRDGMTFDWSDYDSLVMPWLTGEVMGGGGSGGGEGGGEGLTAFPLPVAELYRGGAMDAGAYVKAVVGHFDQRRVLSRTILPAEIPPDLLAKSGGEAAEKVRQPARLETPARSLEGLRQVAWESFALGRSAAVAGVVSPRASSAEQSEDLSRPVWFYPGEWFGRTGVVPAVGIKWARRAQQDREILDLASRRGASTLAQQVARRATRMGMTRTSVAGDLLTPVMSLGDMAGGRRAWEEGLAMVRTAAVSREPGGGSGGGTMAGTALEDLKSIEEEALARWAVRLDVPLMVPGKVTYSREEGELRVRAEIELADPGAEASVAGVPDGWEDARVSRGEGANSVVVRARINPAKLRYPVDGRSNERGEALPVNGSLTLEAVSGANRLTSRRTVVVPVAALLPSPGTPTIDARLVDWSEEELVQGDKEGLRPMWTRRALQSAGMEEGAGGSGVASGDGKGTRVYARWDADTLYMAFRLEGVSAPASDSPATNFTPEEMGRACGESLVRLRVTPVGEGKELRLLLKPKSATVEASAVGVNGTPPRYAASLDRGVWRAELAIPSQMLGVTPTAGVALGWNFVRHDAETGESSSVAGPVDRDYQEISGLMVMVERAPRR